MSVAHLVEFLVQILVGPLEGFGEPFHGVAVAQLSIEWHHGRMAVETRARLRLRLALGVLLIDEYVRGSVLFYVSMFPLAFLTRRRDSKVSAIETARDGRCHH